MIKQQVTMFDMLNHNEKYVRRIRSEDAIPFIENIHYSRKAPNITDAFGLFVNGEMIGIVTYGIPASPSLCNGLAGKKNFSRVRELNRLVIKPKYNGGGYNYASYLVSHSLKMLENGTFVVSYADTAWSHVGYVYQACNFLYTGLSAKRVDFYMPDGKHPRSAERNGRTTERLHQTRSRKHRYIYLVGDRRTKKQMLKELNYKVVDKYPKGDETHYDTSNPKRIIPIEIVQTKKDLLMDEQDVMDALDDPFLGIHNPTVYSSRAEMKAIESESGLD